MLKAKIRDVYRKKAIKFLEKAKIALTPEEKKNLEVCDLGLGDIKNTGLEIVLYVNTERCCAKELVLLPGQSCPEHKHPSVGKADGKEETFRCRWGVVYLYVEGVATLKSKGRPPKETAQYYTVWHEIILKPGQQYTLRPNTLHWFQPGPQGAIVSEFSTKSRDEFDLFTNPHIRRKG